MAQDLSTSLTKITGQSKEWERTLKGVAKAMKDIEVSAGKISGSGGFGGGNAMSGFLGKFSGAAFATVGAIAGAAYQGMPGLQPVMQQATGLYNAAVMQFNPNLRGGSIYDRLRNGLGKFGVQNPQAIAQLGQAYGQMGVRIGTAYEGQLTRAAGNAASYLNMDAGAAAQAMAGLNSGAGSANLLRRFGIFTANPVTGEKYGMNGIFSQLYGRFTAGRGKATAADVQESYFRGNLGATLRNSGLSEEQQQMFLVYASAKASGQDLDLSDNKAMAAARKKLEDQGIINPQLGLNQIAGSESDLLRSYSSAYIEGVKQAVPAIEAMNNALMAVPESVKALVGSLQAIASTGAGSAAGSLFGDALSGIGSMLGGFLGGKMGGKGKGAPKANALSTMRSVAKMGGLTTAVLGAGLLAHDVMTGQGFGTKQFSSDTGGIVGALAGGAIGTAIMPGVGTILGGIAGSFLGTSIGGMFGSGSGGGYEGMGAKGSPGTTTNATNDRPVFVKPASGNVTSGYGPRKAPTKGASTFHRGVDIANAMGTSIGSSSAGSVIFAGSNGSFGNHVKVQHSGGYVSTYSHLSRIEVSRGDRVSAGQLIGRMGTTGVSTGSHLHFEILRNGSNIDPATVVPGLSLGAGVTATITAGGALKGKKTPAQKSASSTASELAAMSLTSDTMLGISGGVLVGVSQGLDNILAGVEQGVGTSVTTNTSGTVSGKYTGQGGGQSSSGMAMASPSGTPSGGGNNVTINLSIAKASDTEARRFARIVKDMLENDNAISTIGKM